MVKSILISGVSGGIGKELANYFRNNNDNNVIGIYNNNQPSGLEGVKLFKSDLRNGVDFEGISSAVSGKITFIHCANESIDQLFLYSSKESVQGALSVNLVSALDISRSLLTRMMKVNYGRFIFISSIVVDTPTIGSSIYSLSKRGLDSLSQSISKEYGYFGITSNVIKLGYFETGLGSRLSQSKINDIKNRIPTKKFGKISSIISTIEFIQHNDYLTGSELTLDGGIS